MSEEINSCPFCPPEKSNCYVMDNKDEGFKDYFVRCLHCDTAGPIACNKEEAVKAWNTRSMEKADFDEIVSTLIENFYSLYSCNPTTEPKSYYLIDKVIFANRVAKAVCAKFRPASVDKFCGIPMDDLAVEQKLKEYGYVKSANADKLAEALENLIFTASKLWDEVKCIKDTKTMTVTHPIIEQAKQALAEYEKGHT